MKKFILFIAAVVLLAACGGSKEKSPISNMTGEWVMDGYLNEVVLGQSPMNAGKVLEWYTGVSIGKVENGEAFVLIFVNNHEAVAGIISASVKGHTEGSFAFQCDSEMDDVIDLRVVEPKGCLQMEVYNKNGEIVRDRKFNYVADFHDINDPCGLTAVKVLLEDKWALLDAKDEKIGDVVIDALGNIKGWDDYTTIGVATDAAFGGPDQISLSTGNAQGMIWYVADFMGDRIVLYESISSDESPINTKGAQVFSLIRDNIGD